MKRIIEKLRIRLGIWLLCSHRVTAIALMMDKKVGEVRCIHCGRNPFFKETE